MKCKSYHETPDNWAGTNGRCWGTKECEPCYCGGDESKCDFYLEKRNQKNNAETFNTAEMWLQAQKDEKMYVETSGLASYSLAEGFKMENQHANNTMDLDDWLVRRWKMQECRKITKAEAEKEFGIKIID